MSDIEARLTALEDRAAIERLKYDYLAYSDNKQPEKMRDCFKPGKVCIDYGRIGIFENRDDLVAVFAELACSDHIIEMHHAQNPRIDLISGTRAKGLWGLYYFLIDSKQSITTQLGGYYDDEYEKVDGRWLITATAFHVNSTKIMAGNDGVAKILFAGKTAPIEIDDPSKQAG